MSLRDAVVVGAGPAGTTAAAYLAAKGHRVVLVDRAKFPRGKPCGDYCNPGAVRLLETLGVLPQLRTQGAGEIEGMTVVAQDGSSFTERYPQGRGLLIRRERLDAVLLRRAEQAGAEIVEEYHVDGVSVDGAVEVRARGDGSAITGRLLIVADGMRSTVARRLGLLPGLPQGRFTVGAYFSGLTGGPAGELHLGPGLYGGVARFGDGTANVCLALPRSILHGRSAAQAFAAGVTFLPALGERLSAWRREGQFRVTGPVGFSTHPVVADRSLLAGDAAGQVEPLTGQGIPMAIRSGLLAGEAASRALREGDLSADALSRYARAHRQVRRGTLRVMKTVTALALHPRLTPFLVRRLAARPVLARELLGAAGDVLPPEALLSLRYLTRFLLGLDAHAA